METEQWVVDWFKEKTGIQKDELLAQKGENYFALGWIDSFGFIEFIADLEQAFDIAFENDEFTNRSLSTLSGLVAIINKKRGESA